MASAAMMSLLIVLVFLFECLVIEVLYLLEGFVNIVFHLLGAHPPKRNLGQVALHDIGQMNIIARLNLPIDGFCRVEHVEADVAAGKHL